MTRRWLRDKRNGRPLVWVGHALITVRASPVSSCYQSLVTDSPGRHWPACVRRRRTKVIVATTNYELESVDPSWEPGILVRPIWAIRELRHHAARGSWPSRGLAVTSDEVTLQTVNFVHTGDERFLVMRTSRRTRGLSASVSPGGTSRRYGRVGVSVTVEQLMTLPGELCREWCPVLHRSGPGGFVRCTIGRYEALQQRLAEAPRRFMHESVPTVCAATLPFGTGADDS